MGTYTSKLNLYKPDIGETGWGEMVSGNFDIIDAITPAQISAEPAFTKNSAFNKNFGTAAGTVCQGNDSRIGNASALTTGTVPTARLPAATKSALGGVIVGDTLKISNGVLNVSEPPIYTIKLYKNKSATSGAGVLELESTLSSDNLSTQTSRENIVKRFARHCLVTRNLGFVTYVNENNFAQDLDGHAVSLDGSQGDFMLEVDTLWWTCKDKSSYWEIKFSTEKFDVTAVTAHQWKREIRKHIYWGVFNGYNSTWLRSVSTSEVPTNSQNITTFQNYAQAGGSSMPDNTYTITNMMDRTLGIILHLFVYKTKNLQDIVKGLNKGAGSSATDLLGCNSGFSATGGWTQGTAADYDHCCMTLGLMNFYGKQWQFVGNTIYNGGNFKIATDAADYYDVAGGTYAGAPATWYAFNTGAPVSTTGVSEGYIKEIGGNNVCPFFPTAWGGNSSTYYADYFYHNIGDRVCYVGGGVFHSAGEAGPFCVGVYDGVAYSSWHIGARLRIHGLEVA